MTEEDWEKLLKTLTIEFNLTVSPIYAVDLDAFEKKRRIKLPRSYRMYCSTFGAGQIARNVDIAVPGFSGRTDLYSLEVIDDVAHRSLEPESYSKDPEQHKRGLFFALDSARSYHFFDPNDLTDSSFNEYAVYTLFEDYTVQKTAATFWEFVADVCLGSKCGTLFLDPPQPQVFMPVT